MKRRTKIILGGLAAVVVTLQFIKPVGKNPPVVPGHGLFTGTNPPPQVAGLLRNACYDCHSNETERPWYGYVAPVSWWLEDHIREGRRHLNFSEWPHTDSQRARKKMNHISDEVGDGSMPLKSYTWMHPAARLTAADRKLLTDWADSEAERLKADVSEK